MTMPHNYSTPDMQARLNRALNLYHQLLEVTGIPGLHTDTKSDDNTPGIFERLQAMQENGEFSLEAFTAFDEVE